LSAALKLPALDPKTVEPRRGSGYPERYRDKVAGREKRALGDACGLTTFGVNLTTLSPGGWSALRHWHSHDDEFIYVLDGELVLVTDGGEQVLGPGMAAGFPGGRPDGHHLINRSARPVSYLEIGGRSREDSGEFPDADLRAVPTPDGKHRFLNKKGEPY